ncbi:hypothetical protein [uncultured Pseudomonas sp.]|uniref:hypothetical protein n=1 Tax=uncultured Pseudomonas sp. TaxID=114707 RepID=UPI0025EBE548|nr:hypothetical protein [uncultured Pseudomonas sp.]
MAACDPARQDGYAPLARDGHSPDALCGRWERERDRIRDGANQHCWSGRKQAYTFYAGAEREEGAFLACFYWMVEAHAVLGEVDQARELMCEVLAASLDGVGLMTEMRDPRDGAALGNFPQGLSHLARMHAALILEEPEPEA